MRYLKFRNILILLEVQETGERERRMVARREIPASKVEPEYAPVSKTNRTKTRNQKAPTNPLNPPPSLPTTHSSEGGGLQGGRETWGDRARG